MPKKKKEPKMIYESPDGGATVYARPINGKGERILIEEPIFPDWYLNEVEISEILINIIIKIDLTIVFCST